jgi:Na+/proline symporter
MDEELTRAIASDISIISITLLAITFGLFALNWKGFHDLFIKLKREEQIELIKIFTPIILITIVFLFAVVRGKVMYSNWEQLQSYILALFYIILIFFGIFITAKLIKFVIDFLASRKKKENPIKLNPAITIYYMSLWFVGISILCSVFALISSINTALYVESGFDKIDDVNDAKWFLISGVLLFSSCIFTSACAYFIDKTKKGLKIMGKKENSK